MRKEGRSCSACSENLKGMLGEGPRCIPYVATSIGSKWAGDGLAEVPLGALGSHGWISTWPRRAGQYQFGCDSGSMGGPTNNNNNRSVVVPPDGGWGWFVVFASFMIHVFTDGVTYSFGVFVNEFEKYFNASSGSVSWIVSIMVGVTLCSGPISSALVNKYGCRKVTIMGGILASASLCASAFAPSVLTLYITSGLLTGLGFGLIYLPAIVSVTCYFEKKRSLATGIAVCGSGLGTFLLAPFISWLIVKLDWKSAMLIVSGLMLNTILFGILFRPLEPVEEDPEAELEEEKVPMAEPERIENGCSGRPHSIHGHENLFSMPQHKKKGINGDLARMALSQPVLKDIHKERRASFKGSGIMNRKDVLFSGSLAHIQHVSKSVQWIPLETKAEREMNGILKLEDKPIKDEEKEEKEEGFLCGVIPVSKETADGFKEMMDFSILTDPIFIVYTVSNFLTSIGFNVPYVHLVSLVETHNVSKTEGSYLLAIIGISNTVGRIVLGYISDKPWINRLWVYNWSLTICGTATALCIFCTGFYGFAVYAVIFGFTIGAYVGLTSVILVDLLGLDKLTNAFGILLLFQGVASLVGPPITGELKDLTDSYSPGFILSGIMMALSGLMLFIVPTLQRWIAKKEEAKASSPS